MLNFRFLVAVAVLSSFLYAVWLMSPPPVKALSDFQSQFSLTEAEMDRLLGAHSWPVEEAKSIAWCESRWSPNARRTDTGDFHRKSGDFGLFQINWKSHHKRAPAAVWSLKQDEPPSLETVAANIDYAFGLYQERGNWSHWTCRLGQRGPAVPGKWEVLGEPARPETLSVEKVEARLYEKVEDWQLSTFDLEVKFGPTGWTTSPKVPL